MVALKPSGHLASIGNSYPNQKQPINRLGGGSYVIIGGIVSPDSKVPASCAPGLNFTGLNDPVTVHRGPQRK